MAANIAVIGSANADLLVRIQRRPLGGETLLGSDLECSPGGKGANQAVAASLLGGHVQFVGCIGEDANGDMLRKSLTAAKVDIDALGTAQTATGCALIFLTPDGENSIVVAPGANKAVTPDFLRQSETAWRKADIVVMQLELPLASVEYVARTCAEQGTRFLLNAAPAAVLPQHVLAACDPLVVNETEAALLLGARADASDPTDLARRLLGRGARSVVITLGAAGSLAADHAGAIARRSAPRVLATDTTGAGDAFVGALAIALATGRSLAAGLEMGTRIATFSVQRPGAQSSYPSTADLAELGLSGLLPVDAPR